MGNKRRSPWQQHGTPNREANHGRRHVLGTTAPRTITTRCCIVGGGPAGMMLGYLLGRAGVDTIVLEKHADFFRDFRGDTVHPSTLQVMDELGLIDGFLKLPHQRLQKMDGSSARLRSASRTSAG